MIKIYKHYNRDANAPEHHTDQQKAEQDDFIDEVLSSPIIKMLKTFLTCHGKLSVRFTVI